MVNSINNNKMCAIFKLGKVIICYILCLKKNESIMKKRFYHSSSAFFSGKISRRFIYPSLHNSEQKFQKNICFKIIGPHHTLTKALCFRYIHLFSKKLLRFWYFTSPGAPILCSDMLLKEQ